MVFRKIKTQTRSWGTRLGVLLEDAQNACISNKGGAAVISNIARMSLSAQKITKSLNFISRKDIEPPKQTQRIRDAFPTTKMRILFVLNKK